MFVIRRFIFLLACFLLLGKDVTYAYSLSDKLEIQLKQNINKSATSSHLDASRSNGGESIAVAPLKTQLAAFNGQGIEFNHWIGGDTRM